MKQFIFTIIVTLLYLTGYNQRSGLIAERNASHLYITHTCSGTEDIGYLSKLYNVPVDSIVTANKELGGLSTTKGILLKIPVYAFNFITDSIVTSVTEKLVPLIHIIQPGEGLWRISVNHYKVSADKIRSWNAMKHDTLKVGQSLMVGYLRMKNSTTKSIAKTTLPVVSPSKTVLSSPKNKVDTLIGKTKVPASVVSVPTQPIQVKTPTVINKQVAPVLPVPEKQKTTTVVINKPDNASSTGTNKNASIKKNETITPAISPTAQTSVAKIQTTTEKNVVKKDNIPSSTSSLKQSTEKAVVQNTTVNNFSFINKANFLLCFGFVVSRITGSSSVSNSYLTDKNPNYKTYHSGGSNQRNGIAMGIGIQNKIGKRGFLQTELQYHQKGGAFKIDSIALSGEKTNGSITAKLNYIGFSFLPGISFGNKQTSFFAYGGAYAAYLLNAKMSGRINLTQVPGQAINLNNNEARRFSKSDFGYVAGVGVKLPYFANKRQHFVIDIRHTKSLGTIGNRVVNGKTEHLLNRGFQFTISYEFNR